MAVVLVDTKYFGHYLRHARNTLNLKRCQCANMLGVSHRDLIRIENGNLKINTAMNNLFESKKSIRYNLLALKKTVWGVKTRSNCQG